MLRNGRIAVLSLAFLLVGACTLQNRYAYHKLDPKLTVSGHSRVALASHDQREYVLNRQKHPKFTGLFRSGFGIPYDITTNTGKPVADEFTDAMHRALKKKGFTTIPVKTRHQEAAEEIITSAVTTQAEKILMLTIYEWKGETFGVTSVHFNLSLDVLDGKGNTIVTKDLSGHEILGGQLLDHLANPLRFAKNAVPREFVKKIEELLNSPEISHALTGDGGTKSRPAKQFL